MNVLGEIFLAFTGRVLVSLLSLGTWRSESIRKESSNPRPAGALSFIREDGRRVVTVTGQQVIGLVFYVLLLAAMIALALEG
jgi:hypothetical protein